MQDAPLLGIGGRRGTAAGPGPGLPAGLDEEVQAEMEQEHVRAAFADRLSICQQAGTAGTGSVKSDKASGGTRPNPPSALTPQVGTLLTRTLCDGLGADLVYLARTHLSPGPWRTTRPTPMAQQQPQGWTIVAHSGPPAVAARPPISSSDMLLSLPLHAGGWHDVGDHRGMPALFYCVPPMEEAATIATTSSSAGSSGRADAGKPELPWAVPPGRGATFRAGAMIGCGTLPGAPALGPAMGGVGSGAGTAGTAASPVSTYLLVALWCDGAHILSGAEQAFAASLAAVAPTWLRQADGLDAHVRALERELELHEHGPMPPPRSVRPGGSGTARGGSRAPRSVRSNRSASADTSTRHRVSASPSSARNDLRVGSASMMGSLAGTLRGGGSGSGCLLGGHAAAALVAPFGQEADAAAVASAAVFAPAAVRTRREDAELGLASAQLMQTAYRRRAQRTETQ